jgi:hypothetical protein
VKLCYSDINRLKHLGRSVSYIKKFWGELIAYLPLIRHGSHRKLCQQSFVVTGSFLLRFYLQTIGYIDPDTRVQKFILLFRVFAVAGTCFQSRSLATIRGINTQTHRLMGGICEVRRSDGFRRHATYIPSFVKNGPGIQKLTRWRGIHKQTGSMEIS